MKRWILLAGLVVAITAAATIVLQYMPEDEPPPRGGVNYPAPPVAKGPQPNAEVVGDPIYKFDMAAQHTKLEKDWVIKNNGEGDLEIKIGPPACSCTVARFEEGKDSKTIKPKESATIHLSFETRDYQGRYHKAATLLTNDARHQTIEFSAEGTIRPAVTVYPYENLTVPFQEISNDEPDHKLGVAVYSPDKPDLKITKLESSRPDLILATQEPMTEEDCKALKIKSGTRVHLDVKAGMPLGSFREEVAIATDHPRQPEIRLTLVGKVVGPISVNPERLRLPDVSSSQGAEKKLRLLVRGKRPTRFEVIGKPDRFLVEVVPGVDVAKTGLYELVITIPPGIPPGEIEDLIVLKTDHPQAGEVKIPVNVYVRDKG